MVGPDPAGAFGLFLNVRPRYKKLFLYMSTASGVFYSKAVVFILNTLARLLFEVRPVRPN